MRLEHTGYLVDPISGNKFSINIFEQEWEHIISWELFCENNSYPIIHWIPRILIGELKKDLLKNNIHFFNDFTDKLSETLLLEWQNEINWIDDAFLKHQQDTASSFWFEWNNIYKENNFEENNFLHFLWWYKEKSDFKDQTVLDLWCWSGRFTKSAANFGAEFVVWLDLSEAVELAFDITKNQKNVLIVQWDIYNIPFEKIFDLIFSIGVLHHLPNPKWWFLATKNKWLKIWWEMLIWVYSRKNNLRALYLYEPVRKITNKLNKRVLLFLCHIPAMIVHFINYISRFIAFIWFEELANKIPFHYYNNFPYNMKLNDAFDVLATPKSNYYFLEDIEEWFMEWRLKELSWKYLREAWLTFIWKNL